jgi:preprotein translocase subunit SecA
MLPGYFDSILGVTGTLEVLPQYKKKQLKGKYGIEDQYAIPSAFGTNKRRTDNYYIVPIESLHQTIIAKINEVQNKRPIIVFFKGARELNEFSQSSLYENYLKRTSNLTEEHEAAVRDSRIVRAVNADTITLMTNSFGRGTDFILLDQAIKENGGLHVIQAFLSHDESEEVQIKGRTARQSNAGSYDCILSESLLEELSLSTAHIPKEANSEAIHNILLKAREDKIDKLSQTTLKLLDESDKKHEDVIRIFNK